MKLCIIVGTRPEVIKMSPVIKECEKRNLEYFILHTGQHYSYELDKLFFEELKLPIPEYNLNTGLQDSRKQVMLMIEGIKNILSNELPDFVLILGDTNSVLAGALASNRLHIQIAHLEAGLRSFDIVMAEEVNRMIADHLSSVLFAPTKNAEMNLRNEGLNHVSIFVSGNTIVDSIYQNLEIAMKKIDIKNDLSLEENEYFILTIHRPESVDIKERLQNVIEGIQLIYEKFKMPIICPLHPRTEKMIKKFDLRLPRGLKVIKPLGYFEFLQLEAKSKLILTDSGGVQEEACILKVPCVTLRDNTERPETIEVGANILCDTNPNEICDGVELMLNKKINNWENPFGNGDSARKIVSKLIKFGEENI